MSNAWDRPKVKITKTQSERIWDIIGYSFYLGSLILLVFVWKYLPQEVPAHYNALGEVERWGSKGELLILPGVGAFLAIFMQIFEKYPEVHNYPQRLNESNAEQFYLNSRKMLNIIKNICLILFALLLFESVSIAIGWDITFGIFFLPVTVLGLVIPIVIGIIKQRKIQ